MLFSLYLLKSKQMNLYLRFDYNVICKKIIQQTMSEVDIKYDMERFGEIHFNETISEQKLKQIQEKFNNYGIDIVENQKSIIIEKIKDVIHNMVFKEHFLAVKSSVYLAEKMDLSYGYISNLFSEITFTSIENYIILQKTEYSKQLINNTDLTLTEIAYKLNYSSVAHLSTQFKKTTGLTPSAFQRIIQKRREKLD